MNQKLQTQWVEGFVKAAAEAGIDGPEDIQALLKATERLAILNDKTAEAYEKAYNEAMEKAGMDKSAAPWGKMLSMGKKILPYATAGTVAGGLGARSVVADQYKGKGWGTLGDYASFGLAPTLRAARGAMSPEYAMKSKIKHRQFYADKANRMTDLRMQLKNVGMNQGMSAAGRGEYDRQQAAARHTDQLANIKQYSQQQRDIRAARRSPFQSNRTGY